MKFVWLKGSGARQAAVTAGALLVVFSLLVFIFPEFFAFVFAGIVLLMGIGLLAAGLSMPKQNSPFDPTNFGQKPKNQTEDGSFEEIQ